jgi:hypothetical protein
MLFLLYKESLFFGTFYANKKTMLYAWMCAAPILMQFYAMSSQDESALLLKKSVHTALPLNVSEPLGEAFAQAEHMYVKGDYAESLRMYGNELHNTRTQAWAHLRMGDIYFLQSNNHKACAVYTDVVQTYPVHSASVLARLRSVAVGCEKLDVAGLPWRRLLSDIPQDHAVGKFLEQETLSMLGWMQASPESMYDVFKSMYFITSRQLTKNDSWKKATQNMGNRVIASMSDPHQIANVYYVMFSLDAGLLQKNNAKVSDSLCALGLYEEAKKLHKKCAFEKHVVKKQSVLEKYQERLKAMDEKTAFLEQQSMRLREELSNKRKTSYGLIQ